MKNYPRITPITTNYFLYYTQYKFMHECVTLLNRITTVQVSDTTMLNSSTSVDTQKEHCTFLCVRSIRTAIVCGVIIFCIEIIINRCQIVFVAISVIRGQKKLSQRSDIYHKTVTNISFQHSFVCFINTVDINNFHIGSYVFFSAIIQHFLGFFHSANH